MSPIEHSTSTAVVRCSASVRPRVLTGEHVRDEGGRPGHEAGGDGEPADTCMKPASDALVVGREGEEERRDADRDGADQREMAGQEGVRARTKTPTRSARRTE